MGQCIDVYSSNEVEIWWGLISVPNSRDKTVGHDVDCVEARRKIRRRRIG